MHKNFNLYKLNPGCLPYTQKFQFVKIKPRLFAYTKIKIKKKKIWGGGGFMGASPHVAVGFPHPNYWFLFTKILKN